MIVRRAKPQEAAELTALIYASKKSNGYDDAFMTACAEELRLTPEMIEAQLVWVAEDDRLLGCVTLETDAAEGEVTKFFVASDAKRRGVGRALWDQVLAAAKEQELTRLTLDADPEAVPFYEAMGFRTIGKAPSGSIPGRFLPLMAMEI